MDEKTTLVGKTLEYLEELMLINRQSKFRAKQVYNWLYLKSVNDFDLMTDLPLQTSELLKEKTQICSIKLKDKQISKDGTMKFLFEYSDGTLSEAVLMRFDNRANLTACISTQVGCPMGCNFCATAKLGFTRNLDGEKLFIDHDITSIQDYIDDSIMDKYDAVDINVYQANMFHTKMMIKEIELQNYLFNTDVRELPPRYRLDIMNSLRKEMIEIFSGRNVFGNGSFSD